MPLAQRLDGSGDSGVKGDPVSFAEQGVVVALAEFEAGHALADEHLGGTGSGGAGFSRARRPG